MSTTTSARNRFDGHVCAIVPGTWDAEVVLALRGGGRLSAVLSLDSVQTLGLAVGRPAVALVKAPAVVLATGGPTVAIPGAGAGVATNALGGQVQTVVAGPLNAVVALQLPGGDTVHAVVTREAVAELGLAPGAEAWALIPASQVMLAV